MRQEQRAAAGERGRQAQAEQNKNKEASKKKEEEEQNKDGGEISEEEEVAPVWACPLFTGFLVVASHLRLNSRLGSRSQS